MKKEEQIGCGYCIRRDKGPSCKFYNENWEAYRYPGGTRDMALKCGNFKHFEEGKKQKKEEQQ